MQAVIQSIPLSHLRLSPRNTRKSRTAESIEAMSASLLAHGQLQNLTVEPADDDPAVFEVIAGGTRLAGLQLLASAGKIAGDQAVPCRVIANGEAIEASAAENLVRTRLAPAEEYDAFRAMADAGKSVEEIALHFGVGELVVKRSLKLANVDPQLFQIFREGHMRVDQLQALALTDDHEAQRAAWFVKQDHMRDAHHIREAITKREVGPDNPLVKFVGADAYEAAGGPVRRDLFSSQVYFGDKALLDKLALDKLEAVADQRRAEGWSWVEVHLTLDYEANARYPSSGIDPKHEKPTTADKQRIKQLTDEIDKIDAEIEALEEQEAEVDDPDVLYERQYDLHEERRQLSAGKQMWSEDAKAKTGVLIWLDRYDGMRVSCGRLRPGQRKSSGGEGAQTGTIAGGPTAKPKPKKPELSAAMLMALSAHRSAAAARAIAADHFLATALLVAKLLHGLRSDHGVSAVRTTFSPARDHAQIAPDIDKALLDALANARNALSAIPKKDTLGWLLKQQETFLQDTLATLVALSFDGITDSPKGHGTVDDVHKAAGIDMGKYWTPAADGFLTRTPAALIVEAVTEACGKDQAAKVAAAKGKEARAAEAAKLLSGTGWLPKPLRGPGYKMGKSATGAKVPAKKKQAKAAKKAPAKKAVSRA